MTVPIELESPGSDFPDFPDTVTSQELQITRETYRREWTLHASVRRRITEEIGVPNRVLYIGMCDDWSLPLTLTNTGHVVGVDVAYWGIGKNEKQIVSFRQNGMPSSQSVHEARDFLLRSSDILRIGKEIAEVTGKQPSARISIGNCVSLEGSLKGSRRRWDFRRMNIDKWPPLTGTFPFIMMRRTFPGVAAWDNILHALSDNGLLYTTGFGFDRQDDEETGSGTGIHESPVPLYFPSELIGLLVRMKGKDMQWRLYQKFLDVDGKTIRDVIRAGGSIDKILNDDILTEVIAQYELDETGTVIGSFIPKDADDLPLFWSNDAITTYIEQSIVKAGSNADSANVKQTVWNSIRTRAVFKLQELISRMQHVGNEPLLAYREEFWRTAGYIPDGSHLVDMLAAHYQRIINIAHRNNNQH
jgi:hypothetical protein